jgi:hypothetical protein
VPIEIRGHRKGWSVIASVAATGGMPVGATSSRDSMSPAPNDVIIAGLFVLRSIIRTLARR